MSVDSRIGRPPKVTPQDIADAALDVGLDKANIRSVAAALGMSVTGLYHHVRTREDLLDLVAGSAFGEIASDAVKGEGFRATLVRYARSLFDLCSRHPEVIGIIYSGRGSVDPIVARTLEHVMRCGIDCGLAPKQVYEIFVRLISATVGAAAVDASDRAMRRDAGRFLTKFSANSTAESNATPLLSALAADRSFERRIDHFETVIMMLDGLCATFGNALGK